MTTISNQENMRVVDQAHLTTFIDTQKNSLYSLQGRVSWSTVSILTGALALAFTSRISGLIIGSLMRMSQNVAVSPKALDVVTNYLTVKNITLAGKVLLGFGVFLMKWEARQANKSAEKAFTAIKSELTTKSKDYADLEKLTALLSLLELKEGATVEEIMTIVKQKVEDAKARTTVRESLIAQLPKETKGTGKDGAILDGQIIEFVQELKAKKEELLNLRRAVLEPLRKSPGSTLGSSDVKDEQIISTLTDLCTKHQAVVDILVAGDKAKESSSRDFDARVAAKDLVQQRKELHDFKEGVVKAITSVDKSVSDSSTLEITTAAIQKVVKLVQDLTGYKTAVEAKFGLKSTNDIGADIQTMQKVEITTRNQANQDFREAVVMHLFGDDVEDASKITSQEVIEKIKNPGIITGVSQLLGSLSPFKGKSGQRNGDED